MRQDKNKSFSLLNQEEIDTLVKFLTEKKNAVDSDVMSQTSIDKLITLIQTDNERLALSSSLSFDSLNATLLERLHFRNTLEEVCELRCVANAETGFLELAIVNLETEQTLVLTPKMFDEEDTEDWGFCLTPSYFNHIAQSLSLKYTQKTHDFVCSTFAKINYGSSEHKISDLFLPNSSALVECLL
jgi:hypothetical protein